MGGKTWKSDRFTSKCAKEDVQKLWETLELNKTGNNDCLSESNRLRRNWTSSRTNRNERRYLSHHVRWGAARHPEGSPGPRRLPHGGRTPVFPLLASLVATEGRRELVGAGWRIPGLRRHWGRRDLFRRFFLFTAQSFRWLFPWTKRQILK